MTKSAMQFYRGNCIGEEIGDNIQIGDGPRNTTVKQGFVTYFFTQYSFSYRSA